jgi:transposase
MAWRVGIRVNARATALHFWALERGQICWAHLLRKFVSFSARAGPGATQGQQLLELTALASEYDHD